MSQILIPKLKNENSLLFQELFFIRKKTPIKTTVNEVACVTCNLSLDNGVSVTAKKIGQKIGFFCQNHFPQD